jgi:hypothetical protein
MKVFLTGATGPAGTLLLGVSGPSHRVREVAAAARRRGRENSSLTAGGSPKQNGLYADALVLDQQASGRRAQELLGWRPYRPDVLEDMERASYRSMATAHTGR